MNTATKQQTTTLTLLTVPQFCANHSFISQSGLRFQIFNADNNGLSSLGAIVRMGRKVLIDESRYFEWVESLRKKRTVVS